MILAALIVALPLHSEALVDDESFEDAIRTVTHGEYSEGEIPLSHHSAFIFLSQRAAKEVVPHLIEDLSYIQKKTRNGKKKKVRLQCTWWHLLDALMAHTGENFGYRQKDWKRWWDEIGSSQPPEFFQKQVELFQANKALQSTEASYAD